VLKLCLESVEEVLLNSCLLFEGVDLLSTAALILCISKMVFELQKKL